MKEKKDKPHRTFLMPSLGLITEKHVVSFELSKQLKEKGFPQETEFYWLPATPPENGKGFGKGNRRQPHWKGTWNEVTRHKICSAPLLTELLQFLPGLYRTPDEAAEKYLSLN